MKWRTACGLGRRARLGGEEGRVSVFVTMLALGFLILGGLVLDGGLALAAKIQAIGEAEEAARVGAQEIDLTAYRIDGTVSILPDQASAAAHQYLEATGHTGSVIVTGNHVEVSVTVTYRTQVLHTIGIGSLTATGHGHAEPRHGITAVDP